MSEWKAIILILITLVPAVALTWVRHRIRQARFRKKQQETRINAIHDRVIHTDINTGSKH